jgi:chaperonin GroEL
MKKNFSLFDELTENIQAIEDIDNCIKIALGPTGKNGLLCNEKKELKFLTSGSLLIKSLEFERKSSNILLKLVEQASIKTQKISGDGSTTTLLFVCQLLKSSLRFLVNGYNSVLLSNGLKRISYFLMEKILEFSRPISKIDELIGVLKTALGRKISPELVQLLYKSISTIGRDGLLVVEENLIPVNEIEIVQGIELDRGYASSYFVNDLKNFEVNYENPYLLIATTPINSINQLRSIIEYVKANTRPLIIVAEEINKDVISTLVLNNIQKKFKVAVIKFTSIKFMKTGILEDLSLLTHSNYFESNLKENIQNFTVEDLGQAEKVIIKKEKSTFIVSKFSKIIAKRRINELNRELITSETEYEKNLFKTRIARLSGNIAKIKIGVSNQYQIEEERQKIESAINTIKSSLEEGVVPGGGISYLYLRDELKNWGYLNLIGEEVFSVQIVLDALIRPFMDLFENANKGRYQIYEKLSALGYPYGYNLIDEKIVDTFKEGLVDSTKAVRSILWNSLTLVSTIITSE